MFSRDSILNQDVGIDIHYMRWWYCRDFVATNGGAMSMAWQLILIKLTVLKN
jgi:hypothetical protein